jgi:uncharacterized protein involved in exopolysaccharide biosynthesis
MPEAPPPTERDPTPERLLSGFQHLLEVLRLRWRWPARCASACLALAPLYLVVASPTYQATCRLVILQQGGRPLNVGNNDPTRVVDGNDDYIQTQAVILRSPLVVQRAIDSVGLDSLPSLRGSRRGRDPLPEANRRLRVTRPERLARVLQVDYQARSPDEAVRMVEGVTRSYRKFLEDSSQKSNSEVVALITRARDELSGELKGLEKQYLQFRSTRPSLLTDERGRPLLHRRLDQWDRSANEARAKAVQLEAQLKLGRKLAQEGTELWVAVYAMSQLGGDSTGGLLTRNAGFAQNVTSDYVRQLTQEQQQLAERYGPRYARVQELQEQITRAQEYSRSSRARLEKGELLGLLNSIEGSLKSVEAMRREIDRRFKEDQALAHKADTDLLIEANLKDKLERERALFSTVVAQLKQAQFAGDYSSIRAQVIEPPNALPDPVSPRWSLVLALALVGGTLAGVGAAVAAHRLDPHLRSPEEAGRALGLPVLGQVPELTEAELASRALPGPPAAEAYRSAGTRLELRRRKQRLQVVLVASPRPGEGRTTTATNLALALASAGQRVLLVAGGGDDPPPDRLAGPAAGGNLSLAAAGEASWSRLSESLGQARQAHDTVVLDSPPLLGGGEAALLAAQADGVVLVVRPGATRRDEAEQALEILRATDVPVVGVLFNAVSRPPLPAVVSYAWGVMQRGWEAVCRRFPVGGGLRWSWWRGLS